jgi:transposase
MVWGCMGYAGVGELAIVEGIMNTKRHVNILRGNLKKSVRKLGMQDSYLFQQDNDPKHTARITREWLLYNARGLLETPPQSPDINPIENLWSLWKK